MSEKKEDQRVHLVELPSPTEIDSLTWTPTTSPVNLTPEQHIFTYSDKQWEEFVLEFGTALTEYKKVMRTGGAHDHGVDVAGFLTESGFEGVWDNYQCKHYAHPLREGDAYPEIIKIVLGTMDGHFTWPRKYYFVAPKGYGTRLARVLNSPSKIAEKLSEQLSKQNSSVSKLLKDHDTRDVLEFIKHADFSGFTSIELHELVEIHKSTRWHAARFGVALPERGEPEIPQIRESEAEQRYVSQLLAAYRERHRIDLTPVSASQNSKVNRHFLRQRVAFYTAESLRVFARDSVPENTFPDLQNEILDAVIEVHDAHEGDGLSKLLAVTESARSAQITGNGLLPKLQVVDRAGICHQLVNDRKLTWCDATTQ